MDSAVAALIGASIGAIAGVVGVLLTNILQARSQHKIWIRDKKAEAYANALRHLYRLTNKRSKVMSNGAAILSEEHQKEWFDDYIATIESLSAISIYSREEFENSIEHCAIELRVEMEKIILGYNSNDSPLSNIVHFQELAESLEDEITLAAVRDLT